jgi:outer membrane lipoprotein carrier protein
MGVCVISAAVAQAGSEMDQQGKLLLDSFVRDIQTLSARFEQSLVDDNDIVVEESRGTVEIHRPGRFRWSYEEPYEQLLVADGLNVWSYDVDLAQVTVKSQQKVLGSTPALLLGGAASALEDFEFIGSFEDRGTVWIRLRPKDMAAGFSKIELGFTDGSLSRMIFSDNLEQTTLIALFEVKFNEDIDDERFRFVPPADADLVGEPVTADNSGL